MGMSASQARLLSLKARQSNLEYQGQQINQARSILSQQCTALYNSLLSMTVPTPPATTDFTKVEYKGTQGSSKFTLGTITPEKEGTYNIEIKYARNGHAVEGGTYSQVGFYDEPEFYYGENASAHFGTQEVTYYPVGDEVQSDEILRMSQTGAQTRGLTTPTLNNNTNIGVSTKMGYTRDTEILHQVHDYDEASKLGEDLEFFYQGKYGFEKANDYKEALDKGDGTVLVKTTIGDVEDKLKGDDGTPYNWNGENNREDYIFEEPVTSIEGGLTEDQFNDSSQYLFFPDGRKVSISDCTKRTDPKGNTVYVLPLNAIYKKEGATEGEKITNTNYDPTEAKKVGTVGGNQVLDFNRETLRETYDTALKAIANTFPEYKDGKVPNESEIIKSFSVIMKKNEAGDLVPYFIKTAEYQQQKEMVNSNGQGQVEIFSLEPNGSYQEAISTPGCKLSFDTSGRITTIDIPLKDDEGNFTGKYDTVSLEAETVTDDAAYKDAYTQYEYETYLYDQKNKEINAKTEVIQQEDRNLELKLQRLDNERTQITTEIEAVEKVIKDNIEASYKSFSG